MPFEYRTFKFIQNLIFFILVAESIQAIIEHVFGDNQHLIINFYRGVNKIILEGNRQIGGDRPGRGGPNHNIDFMAGKLWQNLAHIGDKGKLDINRRRRMIGIFHFSLSQRRLTRGAPVHRFLTLIHTAIEVELAKLGNRCRFVRIGHRQIRIIPLTKNAQTLKLFALHADKFLGIGAAGAAFIHLRHALFFTAQFFIHLMFNGQAVAIPARHINTIKPGHVFGFDDNIFNNFIERRAQVNIAISIGRAIMQNVWDFPFGRFPDFRINVHFFPILEHLRLALRQIRLHRKISLGKIQCLFVIHFMLLLFICICRSQLP